MEIAIIIVSCVLVLYLIFCVIAAHCIVKGITNPKYSTREQRQERNRNHGFLEGTECYERKDVTFKMHDGYIIHGDISLKNPKKFVVFAHGHGSTREGVWKYTKLFYDMDYSLVLYDERGHGDNERVPCTMGFKESKDLAEIVRLVREKYGSDIEIGIFGYSMGGATSCLASQYLQGYVKFFVIDCAFSSLKAQCHKVALEHFAAFFPTLIIVNIMFKLKYGFSFKDCNVKDAVSRNDVPICFFHGRKDKTVFPINSEILYNASKAKNKRLYIFENAGHSKSVEVDRKSYESKLRGFIESIGD